MSGTYVVQPQTRAAGNTGHVGDHDNLGFVLANNGTIAGNVLNTAYAGGADPTGANDCTAAFQACLTALIAASGGIMYIPAGSYLLNSALTWNSSQPLTIIGDGPGVTVILLNNSSSNITYLSVTNSTRVTMSGFSMNNNQNAPSFFTTNVGILCTSVTWATFQHITMQTAGATNRMNTNMVFNNCTSIDIDACDLRSYVNNVVMEGSTAALAVRATSFGQNTSSGVGTAASILVTGNPQTLHVTNVVFNSGDRGLLLTGGTGANPAFIWLYDAELNNMAICGLQFNTGAEVWATACWIASNNSNQSVYFASAFQGAAYFSQCVFQGNTQHSVVLGGGSGYDFTSCVWGDSGTGKANANTWDGLNIQGTVSNVTVHNCHFNVDPYYGIGSTPPRAAVYVNSGATNIMVEGNLSLSNSNYGTAALVAPVGTYTSQDVNMSSTYEVPFIERDIS